MYFVITADRVELVDPTDVRMFCVRCPAELSESDLAASIERAELGEVLNSDHVMVAVAAIRRMAVGRVGPGWDDDLAGMLGYAASKGWTSQDGSQVRAHVEKT
jgi:hypothetical protein